MRCFFFIAVFLVTGCSSKGQEEEQKYEIVMRENATIPGMYRYKALCPQAKAAAQAYLDEKDAENYQRWHMRAELDCSAANDPYAK